MSDNNVIPLVDVEKAAAERTKAHGEAAAQVQNYLTTDDNSFIYIQIDEENIVNAVVMGHEAEVMALAMGMVTLLGAQRLGDAAMSAMPQETSQAMAQATGLSMLNKFLQDSMKPQATPASDIGAEPETTTAQKLDS